jgi:hypothetical protein
MADVRQSGGLRTIFSFFLGLMVTAFIGVGVYTFHPSPQTEFDLQIQDLNRQEHTIRDSRSPDELTTADRDQIQELDNERDELRDAARVVQVAWGRSTSIVLIMFATLAMAVSLLRADQLPVISNGLLLGGVFTMVYGVGWIIATNTSVARFIVMTVALVITLALGYVRFVRRQAIPALPGGRSLGNGEGLADIEQRVRQLEERMNEAANALGRKSDRSPLP